MSRRTRLRLLMKRVACAGAAASALLFAAGCATIGPPSIRNGRAAYNEAIVASNNEQILAMIVRMRYGEPAGLLAVSSVTAGVRMQGTVGAQAGVGASSNYAGNLVPLTAGVLYEESPTITYTPVQGDAYLRQLLSPLPLDLTILLLNATGDSELGLTLLVQRINGVRNAGSENEPDARFATAAREISTLHSRGECTWVQESGSPRLALLLQGQGAEFEQSVRTLAQALALSLPATLNGPLVFPVTLGAGTRTGDALDVQTRSVYELFAQAAAGVDVPPEHLESGFAQSSRFAGVATENIRIVRTASQPSDALVAYKHHGWWYSIDGRDQRSKTTFRILEALISARLTDTAAERSAMPILTIPASR